jgi:hypothetical protein
VSQDPANDRRFLDQGPSLQGCRSDSRTKDQLLKQMKTRGVTNWRGRPLTSEAIGTLLRDRPSAGIVDVSENGARQEW